MKKILSCILCISLLASLFSLNLPIAQAKSNDEEIVIEETVILYGSPCSYYEDSRHRYYDTGYEYQEERTLTHQHPIKGTDGRTIYISCSYTCTYNVKRLICACGSSSTERTLISESDHSAL